MAHRFMRYIPALAPLVLLSGCQSGPPDGTYLTFVRELMVASAELKEEAGDGPDRSEQAERAVGAWRGAEDDQDTTAISGQ